MKKRDVRTLPLVEYICDLFTNVSLEDVLIIGCQHLLPTTHRMIYSLINCGLRPENIHLLGKCYSSDPDTVKRMEGDKISIHPSSFSFIPSKSYDSQYQENVKSFLFETLKKVELRNYKKVIVLDDGGSLIKLFNELPSADLSNIVGVEQTTSGYDLLQQEKIHFPVINVARSKTKLNHEKYLIAEVLSQKILSRIKTLNLDIEKILIIGNGAIGSATKELLKEHFSHVDSFDISPLKTNVLKRDYKKKLSSYDMIIGCTGKTVFTEDDIPLLKKGVVLASASSSDREFNAVMFRGDNNCKVFIHGNIVTDTVTLLNNGFPLNFDDDYLNIDHEGFQLTRSLIAGAIFQAIRSNVSAPKMLSLSQYLQRHIENKYSQIGSKYILNRLSKVSTEYQKEAVLKN